MKKYCFILGFFFLLSFRTFNGISGQYKVIFDTNFDSKKESSYYITIRENNYTKKFSDGENIEGGITIIEVRNSKKVYYLSDFLFFQPKAKIVEGKLKTLGKVIMEVEELNADTLTFRRTYQDQLNVTIDTGKLVREK